MLYKSQGVSVGRPWGGQRFPKSPGSSVPVGEVWEVSTHPQGPSIIEGVGLDKFMAGLGPQNAKGLPYLVKWLDTAEALSVQVHPNDDFSLAHEGQRGKNECWVVLEAAPGAHLYLGLESGVSKAHLMSACRQNKSVPSCLQKYEASAGDFFYVPAGSVHALGPGLTLMEVQQSSGVTYRLWDWGRVDEKGQPRELHLDKGEKVVEDKASHNTGQYFLKQSLLLKQGFSTLVETSDFRFEFGLLKAGESFVFKPRAHVPGSIFCLKGQLTVRQGQENLHLKSLQSAISFSPTGVHVVATEPSWVGWVD